MTAARRRPSSLGFLIGAFAAGAVVFAGLAWASQPSKGAARIAALRAKVETARTLTKQGPASDAAGTAPCAGEIGKTVAPYRSQLARLAANTGVELIESEVTESPAADDGLSSAAVTLTARGAQEADLAFLSALGGEAPSLRVRRLDLQPREGAIVLSLEGTIWCVG